jgi:hypothetical protein
LPADFFLEDFFLEDFFLEDFFLAVLRFAVLRLVLRLTAFFLAGFFLEAVLRFAVLRFFALRFAGFAAGLEVVISMIYLLVTSQNIYTHHAIDMLLCNTKKINFLLTTKIFSHVVRCLYIFVPPVV